MFLLRYLVFVLNIKISLLISCLIELTGGLAVSRTGVTASIFSPSFHLGSYNIVYLTNYF
jgi:hypothetical protein